MAQVQHVPNIQQTARIAGDTQIHYGYVAFRPIKLGYDLQVQPGDGPDGKPISPYTQELPHRELLPFTNITVSETDGTWSDVGGGNRSASIRRQRTAGECVRLLQLRYEDWGFTELSALRGLDGDDAFAVFQAIQPFTYKLKDLVNELGAPAESRIFATEPYTVEYEGEKIEMRPLRGDLREFADTTRLEMLMSAKRAFDKAELVVERSTRSLRAYHSGRPGKQAPDPLDKYVFPEMDRDIPTMDERRDTDESLLKQLANAILGTREEKESAEADAKLAALDDKLRELETLKAELEELQSQGKPARKPRKKKDE